jgi:hypothetical protein
MAKKRIVKDYDQIPEDVISRVKQLYPSGFAQHLTSYMDKEGKKVSALPFETDEVYYLIRMTVQEAKQIIEEDEDYDEEGRLRDDFQMNDDDYPKDDEEDESDSNNDRADDGGGDDDGDDDY